MCSAVRSNTVCAMGYSFTPGRQCDLPGRNLPLLRRPLAPQSSPKEILFIERSWLSRQRATLPLGYFPLCRLLSLLQLLLLLLVFLLQLLRLLLMALLHLLPLRVSGLLFIHVQVLLVLLLL